MKIIPNSILPLKGFVAMTVWPFVFVRKEYANKLPRAVLRHEEIHGEQQRELLTLGFVVASILAVLGCGWWSLLSLPLFFWLYIMEWLVKCVVFRNAKTAYKNISFEREAYDNQRDASYLSHRRHFAWRHYLGAGNRTHRKNKKHPI